MELSRQVHRPRRGLFPSWQVGQRIQAPLVRAGSFKSRSSAALGADSVPGIGSQVPGTRSPGSSALGIRPSAVEGWGKGEGTFPALRPDRGPRTEGRKPNTVPGTRHPEPGAYLFSGSGDLKEVRSVQQIRHPPERKKRFFTAWPGKAHVDPNRHPVQRRRHIRRRATEDLWGDARPRNAGWTRRDGLWGWVGDGLARNLLEVLRRSAGQDGGCAHRDRWDGGWPYAVEPAVRAGGRRVSAGGGIGFAAVAAGEGPRAKGGGLSGGRSPWTLRRGPAIVLGHRRRETNTSVPYCPTALLPDCPPTLLPYGRIMPRLPSSLLSERIRAQPNADGQIGREDEAVSIHEAHDGPIVGPQGPTRQGPFETTQDV
jgi:hypothetical protein